MRKQGFILVITAFLTIILCSTVSAVDSSDNGGVFLDQASNVNESISDSKSVDQSLQSVSDPVISVKVNYEISSDSGNPNINVEDSTGVDVEFTKTYDSNDKVYSLTFDYPGVADGSKFKVIVSAPGYVTEEQEVTVAAGNDGNFHGQGNFNLEATSAYKLGCEVTKKADQLLNFASADDVLCITTAGVPKFNGGTSEDCIEGILNTSNGRITYGKGNLLMLRQTTVDPVDFAFIIKKGSTLRAVCFSNGSSTPVYVGTISQNMEKIEWNTYIAKVGGTNAYSYASLANAWKAGAPADLLREAAFHGHVCQGTISGYSIIQALLKYYPPIQETSGGSGSPGDITSYKVLGVPGDSDDDAAMYFLDATPGKSGYAGYDTTNTGTNSSMVGFIRWNGKTNSGELIIIRFKREEIRQEFQKETGITLKGDLAELKFNSWIVNRIKTNPEQLVEFIEEFSGLSEEQYYYLLGTATDIKNTDGTVRIPAQEAHGLDMNYIKGLNLANATRNTTSTANQGQLTYNQMKQIGVDATNLAKQIFKEELGIDLEKDDRDLAILTSAGYVHLNGQTTEAAWDGIYQVLGSRLSRSTLLPVHTGLWKPLWFNFVLRGVDGQTMSTIYLRYDVSTKQFFVGSGNDGKKVNNIGPAALNDKNQLNNLNKVYPDSNFFNIQSIANAWRNDPPFDQLVTFLFHDHACPGVQPGFFISDYVFDNYPLTADQSYFYMGSTIYCKDDSLVYLMGISPGMGTYMNDRLKSSETVSEALPGGTEEGLLVIWDSKTNIGKAVVVNFKWATLDMTGLTTSEAQREAQIAAYVSMYKGEPNSRVQVPTTTMASDEKYITEREFKAIKEGGTATTSFLQYVKDLPVRSLSDLLPQDNGNNGNQNNNGDNNGQSYDDTDSSTDGSVGDSGLALIATLQATATEAGQQQGDTSTAHEITPVTSESSSSSSWGVAAVVGVLVVLALGAFGFFWKGRGSA